MTLDEFFSKHGFSAAVDADALLAEFDRQMDAGLAARPSALAMLPAYLDVTKEVPVESPIIVLDAGGTNLRVAVVWFDRAGKAPPAPAASRSARTTSSARSRSSSSRSAAARRPSASASRTRPRSTPTWTAA